MKQFIWNATRAMLGLGTVMLVYEKIGRLMAGDYHALIWWGITATTAAVGAFIVWRFIVGVKSGYLLYDDMNEE